VGEVNLLGHDAVLMLDERQIPFLEVLQSQRLNRPSGEEPLDRFLAPIDEALLGLLLVSGATRFEALMAESIPVGHPPHLATFVEAPG
jgi:hypothetical protein